MNLALPIRILLWPLSAAWGIFTCLRAWSYAHGWLRRRRLNGIVISVGNLTVGGTGKTPMVLWIAERLLAQGKRVAILSRGYRGSRGTSDEVELMKERLGTRVAFGVGENRFVEGKRLEEQGIDVFLLDDGFQHLQLARDLDIVLVDASQPLEREWLLPSGRLREPLSALDRAGIVVMTRASECGSVEDGDSHGYAIFHANTRLLGFRNLQNGKLSCISELGPGPFFAFCGIGNPRAFLNDLHRWQVPVAGMLEFQDHHRYSSADVRRIEEAALKFGATGLVTTEKDAVNLRGAYCASLPVLVFVVEMEPNSESEFLAVVDGIVRLHGGAAA